LKLLAELSIWLFVMPVRMLLVPTNPSVPVGLLAPLTVPEAKLDEMDA